MDVSTAVELIDQLIQGVTVEINSIKTQVADAIVMQVAIYCCACGGSMMNVKDRLKALIETVCRAYENALIESPKPPRTPFTREDVQESERQRALRALDALEKRIGDA